MPAGASTTCPHCQATLKLKSESIAGKTVPCPKCGQSFVVSLEEKTAPTPSPAPDVDDEFDFGNLKIRETTRSGAPAPVRGKIKKPKPEPDTPEEDDEQPSRMGKVFRALICINAHLAIWAVVFETLWELIWIGTHWAEFRLQSVSGRVGRALILKPFLVIGSALYVWWETVLPRDIGSRHLASLLGGAYIFLFGVVGGAIVLMASSMYDRPLYAINWGVIYLGCSLLAFVRWGYPPETPLQLAERLTSEGRYSDALTIVNIALQKDPDDQEAYELYRALRDLMRHG